MDEDIKGEVVVDSSFILAFLLPDEKVDKVDEIFDLYEKGRINFVSTQLLPFEILNGLRNSTLRKRITKPKAKDLAIKFSKIKIILTEIDLSQAPSISLTEDLSFYDASYACLAKSKGVALLTFDSRLKRIASK